MSMPALNRMPDIISDNYTYENGTVLLFPVMPKMKEQASGSGSSLASASQCLQLNETSGIKPIYNCREQVEYLRDKVHFNISQLATIFKVKRPTIYEWLEEHNPSRKNLQRLDAIYSLFNNWNEKIEVRMGNYFYKEWEGKQSLYDLLTMDEIHEEKAAEYILKIQNVLLVNQEARITRQDILDKASFEPVDQRQKERVLRRLLRRG